MLLVRFVGGAVGKARGQRKNEHPATSMLHAQLSVHVWLKQGRPRPGAACWTKDLLQRWIEISTPPHSGPPPFTNSIAIQSAKDEGADWGPTCAPNRHPTVASVGHQSFRCQSYQLQRIFGTAGTGLQRVGSGSIHVEESQRCSSLQNQGAARSGVSQRGLFSSLFQERRGQRPGFRIGRYVLVKLIGEGAFAKVFLAKNVDTKEPAAIKIYERKEIMGSAGIKSKPSERMRWLMTEIACMMAVRHPYIVQLHQVLATKYYIYLVMEYVPGGSLSQKLEELEAAAAASKGRPGHGGFSEDEARRYFQQLIDAVNFCHGKGVFHRDLKPENLLLDGRGNLKVADFGLSGITSQAQVRVLKFYSVRGTRSYMAPEVVRGFYRPQADKVGYMGATTDIWSCGVILFELLCGHLPFESDDVGSISGPASNLLDNILTASYHTPNHVSVPARKLIGRILDPDVSTRITAAGIYVNDWFKTGYTPPNFREIQEVEASLQAVEAAFNQQVPAPTPGSADTHAKPAALSAFTLLSGSVPVDLSPLVAKRLGDTGAMEETRLTSKLPAREVLRQIHIAATSIGFSVQIRLFRMKLVAQASSPRQPICVVGEVFDIPGGNGIVMVILRKVTGDSQDYEKFSRLLCNAVKHTMREVQKRL